MNKYKCDICGKPATIHITKIVDGKKTVVHLCQDCAAKNAADVSAGIAKELIPQIQEIEKEFLEKAKAVTKKADTTQELVCSGCGSTFEDIEKSCRFHCPQCAETFGEKALEMIKQMQGGNSRHIGKIPRKYESKVDTGAIVAELKMELERAVNQERYEDAARIRDKLKTFRNQ